MHFSNEFVSFTESGEKSTSISILNADLQILLSSPSPSRCHLSPLLTPSKECKQTNGTSEPRGMGSSNQTEGEIDVLWHSIERPLAIIPTTTAEPRQFQDYNNTHRQ